jgi:hypothetical protein
LFSGSLLAQAPEKMSFQAVIRNPAGQLITNQQVAMRISILQGSETGNPVYTETQAPMTNANGLITIEIGTGTTTGHFDGMNWAAGPFFIKTETDPAGGSDYSITGTSQMLSVPYALHAKTAESLTAGANFKHYTGELYGGGIVVGVWKENGQEHGLIASLSDLSWGEAWSSVADSDIGPAAQSPVNGQANTLAIISQPGHEYSAAQVCADYQAGGYSDWYLPAAWELNLCYQAAFIVNSILGAANGFQFNVYWSSTEDPYVPLSGYFLIFYSGKGGAAGKDALSGVRAVRKF